MFDKISRSWSLAGQCWDVLREDPSLLIFPLLSSLAMLVLLGSFALPVLALHHDIGPFVANLRSTHMGRDMFYGGFFGFYVVNYTVMMFFNSALVGVALKRLDGESASIGDGLRMALAHLPSIVGYAIIAATVGTLLRAVEERVGLVGRIVVGLIGAGWTLATAMTLPVLMEESVGPIDAIFRNLDLLRRNWGENLLGNGGISLGVAVLTVPVFIVALVVLLSAASSRNAGHIVLGMAFFVLTVMAIGLVSTTLHTIYTAALYRFATGSKDNAGIDGALLAGAYRQK